MEFREGRRVSLDEIAQATGIHRTTLSKIANRRGYNCTTDNLDKLCGFFGCRIEGMAEHLPESAETDSFQWNASASGKTCPGASSEE